MLDCWLGDINQIVFIQPNITNLPQGTLQYLQHTTPKENLHPLKTIKG